ncbi:hypothetical protein Q3G72_019594 [Acer saccharum]|nr:hypothetical protein Q3G72_019594 [Acer saccharum]
MASNFLSTNYNTATQTPSSSSQRGVAMVLALISAVVLSPLYVTRSKNDHHHYYYERKLLGNTSYSTFVLPLVLGGLIIAIRTTSSSSSSSSSMEMQERASLIPSPEPSWVLRIGSSSWGLAGVLVMLLLVLSWQVALEEAKPLFLHFNGGRADRRQVDRKREEKDDGRGPLKFWALKSPFSSFVLRLDTCREISKQEHTEKRESETERENPTSFDQKKVKENGGGR